MSPSDRSGEETIFSEALELPEAARPEFLSRACGGDEGLRASVEALLDAHAAASRFPPLANGAVRSAALVEDQPGDWIGRYKLLQKIGEGGCGIVFMAEQEVPVRRRVALKVIKLGMDTKGVVARFEAERQALAMLEHPNIAKVLDAGATEAGRPFFVMELVRGIPVTKYCDEHGLSTTQRLELFSQICHAVQHAHQKGIIHRDIKPSNILVTRHNGAPVPMMIDFGIAKATQGKLTDETLFTAFEQFIGTPAYMSPEQAEMSGLDVDTRSDIYSLGVLLYELLTGRPPFDPRTFSAAGIDEVRRVIREVDPPKPSRRLATLDEADRTTVAARRGTAPAQLSTVLAGDLDWIVMRCLEKDRNRRYDTAAALAIDVQRHLAHEPVAARPPSGAYRLRKFCRRHKAGVIAAAAVTLALVAGLVVSAGMFVRERAARQRAGAAEQAEGRLRQQAEAARAEEVRRAARTALDLANRNLADGRVADGLAYLVYAARQDPSNRTLGPRLASVLTSHNFLLPRAAPLACGSRVLAVRYAQDGRSIFVGTEDGTLRVLDAATGALKQQFQTGGEVVPDGWEFARFNDTVVGARSTGNSFTIYDIATGSPKFPPLQLAREAGLPESTRVVGLSPAGTWAYAVARQQFWLWHADTGVLKLHLEFTEAMQGCDFSPADDTLAIIVGQTVERWSLPDARPVEPVLRYRATYPVPYGAELRFSPDGRRLAVVEPTAAHLLEVSTGAVLHQLAAPGGMLLPGLAAFPTNERMLLGSQNQFGSWELGSGRFVPTNLPNVSGLAVDVAAGRAAVLSLDGLLRVIEVGGGAQVVEAAWRQGTAYFAAISPDGTQVTMGNADGWVHRFDVGKGAARPLVLPGSASPRLPACFLPELPVRLLRPVGDRAEVVQVAAGREVAGAGFKFPEPVAASPVYDTHPPIRSDLRFMVAITARGDWQSWALAPGEVRHAVSLQDTRQLRAALTHSPAGDVAAIGNEFALRAWDLRSGAPLGPPLAVPGLPNPLSASFSPDGSRLVAGARDGAALVFDLRTGQPILGLKTRRQVRILAAQYSPDGSRILTTNQLGESRLWDAVTGEPAGPIVRLMSSSERHRPVFSADGRWAAVPFPTSVTLLDGRTGAEVGRRIPAGGRVVRFSPDGQRIGTAERHGHAQVWDVPSGEAVSEPLRSPGGADQPQFSPDGRFLKTEGSGLNVWAVPPPLPEGMPAPEWLLELATLCASQRVNETGQLVPATETFHRVDHLRHLIATLPAEAPLAEWGRWVLDDRPDRPIAPGFTITPAEAGRLAANEPLPPR